jgi:hypothetical protein
MKLEARLQRLEAAISGSDAGLCQCRYSGPGILVWPDGAKTEHDPCPWCSKERPLIKAVVDDSLKEVPMSNENGSDTLREAGERRTQAPLRLAQT